MTTSFTKIMTDEAVSGWKYEIHVRLVYNIENLQHKLILLIIESKTITCLWKYIKFRMYRLVNFEKMKRKGVDYCNTVIKKFERN